MKFGTLSAGGLERFRKNTATTTPISLRRKQCACGKIVTAKQLVQHGACGTCAQQQAKAKKAA
ncbi:hypothetical protein [Massilia yuzhufengensis]|uniref:Uncharacterized protein n=1 Tax=Massilia yuzhufengensis TaxID=1164594 RepID=A0A1I1VT78_9BURK|nr:hypothetical protein [Massilia yuzhufengensis]SFD84253.1 hypothetical protein SAMN05216204_14050 [Massilia yuzhufengensis]